jgi:glycosyltransferase involved in cell wall biosynthesis
MRQVIYLPIVNYIEAYNLKRASIIVVVSEALRQSLVAEGVDPNKIFVNPNGYDSSIFYPGLDGRAVRKLHGVTNEILVAFMGTFGPWHGVIELAKSILKFYEFFPSLKQKVKFMLIGDGMLYNEVRALLSSADVSADIIFTGLIPQLDAPKYLAAADILVSPHVQNPDGTRFFGSPTKLFEYMAVGKAIVASDLDQIGEVLVHKESAYLVKPGSVEELVDAIKVLIDDKSLREKIAFGAHSKVSKYYTWDANVERLLERMTHAFS